jgi:4a-hydroxytetrahydrobiopterin dehydratase
MLLSELLNKDTSQDVQIPSDSIKRVLGTLTTTLPASELPVEATQSAWRTVTDPERLMREFEFSKFSHLKYFVDELLIYQQDTDHHAKITIDHLKVIVETYTKDFDGVTSQDRNLASFCDEIYGDTKFLTSGV